MTPSSARSRSSKGTFLDYALKLDGKPRVYVEAKGLNENLDDKKFIAQTLNYANNDGVDVVRADQRLPAFRVYKTNEPVAMDRKLLFEVDLNGEPRPPGEGGCCGLSRATPSSAETSTASGSACSRMGEYGRRSPISRADPPRAPFSTP